MSDDRFCNIAAVEVRKLLGCFDYSIGLFASEHLTILIAPNGYGKTSLLRLVDAFFNSRYAELTSAPFEQLTFRLRDGSSVTVDFVQEEDDRLLRVRSSKADAPELKRRTAIRPRTSERNFQETAECTVSAKLARVAVPVPQSSTKANGLDRW